MRPTTTKQNNKDADPSRDQQENIREQVSAPPPGYQHHPHSPRHHPDTDDDIRNDWLLFEAWRVGVNNE